MSLALNLKNIILPERSWEVKLELQTETKTLVQITVKEKARSKKQAEKKAVESAMKMIRFAVVGSNKIKNR